MAAAQGFLPVYTETGGPPVLQSYALEVSQTIKRGYPLRADSTSPGSLSAAAAAATGIMAVAAEDKTTTASEKTTRILAWPVSQNTIFEGKNTGTGRPEAWLGDLVDFEITTSVNYRVNEDGSTTKVLKVVGIHPDDQSGTASGKRIRFKFAVAKSQYDGAMEVS